MSNGKTMMVPLITGLIKKTQYKWMNIFQNQEHLEDEWKLN